MSYNQNPYSGNQNPYSNSNAYGNQQGNSMNGNQNYNMNGNNYHMNGNQNYNMNGNNYRMNGNQNYSMNGNNYRMNGNQNYNQYNNQYAYQTNQTTSYAPFEGEGVGQTLKRVATQEVVSKSFIFMFFGLLFTAFAAFTCDPITIVKIAGSSSFLLLTIIELLVVFAGNYAIAKDKPIAAAICFTIYCYMTGALLSVVFLAYELSSVAFVFVATAVVFGVMAVFGMVTKKDITKIGNFLFMSLLAIIIVSAINIFIGSSTLELGISVVGTIVFMAYTAYDVQKIKNIANQHPNRGSLCIALYGGFQLYLDFINLFLRLLRFFGKRND